LFAEVVFRNAEFGHIMAYVLRSSGQRITKITRDAILASANGGRFLNDREVSLEMQLTDASEVYTLLPCLRHAGKETTYTLSILSNEPVTVEPFEDNV
jgi:hypothetical protein